MSFTDFQTRNVLSLPVKFNKKRHPQQKNVHLIVMKSDSGAATEWGWRAPPCCAR